jgi:hypothetical protein
VDAFKHRIFTYVGTRSAGYAIFTTFSSRSRDSRPVLARSPRVLPVNLQHNDTQSVGHCRWLYVASRTTQVILAPKMAEGQHPDRLTAYMNREAETPEFSPDHDRRRRGNLFSTSQPNFFSLLASSSRTAVLPYCCLLVTLQK